MSIKTEIGDSALFSNFKITKNRALSPISPIVYAIVILFLFANIAYAKTTAKDLPQVEKLFMEAKYERVVTEANNLIETGAHGREELHYLKGLSLMRLNRFREARRTFEYMAERYPNGKRAFDGYAGIGDSYFLEGKFNEAIAAYNEVLKNFPDHKNSAVVYYKMGNSYQKLGISDKANEYFGKVKSVSPLSFESRMISDNIPAAPEISAPAPLSKEREEPDAGDYYYVQAGYFKTKANADRLNEKLCRKGYESCIATLLKSNATFYRVKVGRFKSKTDAEIAAKNLKRDGYVAKVCR